MTSLHSTACPCALTCSRHTRIDYQSPNFWPDRLRRRWIFFFVVRVATEDVSFSPIETLQKYLPLNRTGPRMRFAYGFYAKPAGLRSSILTQMSISKSVVIRTQIDTHACLGKQL